MHKIAWKKKAAFVREVASKLMRDANKSLDLSDRRIWQLTSLVGCELDVQISAIAFEDDWSVASALHSWVLAGFTLNDDFPDWSGPQLMAALATYLVADTEELLDVLPEPEMTTYAYGIDWRRDQVIERCANSIMEAMQSCYYGQQLIGREITPNPERLAELMKSHDSAKAKRSVSARQDQILKPGWLAHCKRAIDAGHPIEKLDDLLNISGYAPAIGRIQPATLRKWAASVGVVFKPGRPKNV